MENKERIEEYKKTRSNVSAILNDLEKFVAKYPKAELPTPPNSYKLAKEVLEKSNFNIVVCGKVKNGKSSMINALIGQDILPVNSDVATSIAFQVSNAEEESFFVVYANGDRKEISREDLIKYGSQNEIDVNGLEDVSKSVAYIEVKTPVKFLPQGVTITDTPGTGSTYPHHTAITKQQIKLADAVIYVMNPSPLEAVEVEFIKEISEITPSIMFVMTKVDLDSPEAIVSNIESNHKHIEGAIGGMTNKDFSILPMSSLQLMNSANSTNEKLAEFSYNKSGYDTVKDNMQLLIYQTVGFYRAGSAYNEAVDYFNAVLNSLTTKKTAADNAIDHYNELVDQFNDANKKFSEQMGDSRRQKILSDIDAIIATMKSEFNNIFSSKGTIYSDFEKEIDGMSLDECVTYSESLGSNVVSRVQEEWDRITKLAYRQMTEIIANYNNECQLAMPTSLKLINSGEEGKTVEIGGLTKHELLTGIRSEMLMGTAFTGAIGTIAFAAKFFAPALINPAMSFIAPVMVIMSVGVILWGALSGNEKAKRQKLEKNQKALKKYVSDVLSDCQKQLLETSLADNKYESLYQGFIKAIKEQAKSSLDEIYLKYSKELESMKQTVMDAKQNPKIVEALDFMITDWQRKKTLLQSIGANIENLTK